MENEGSRRRHGRRRTELLLGPAGAGGGADLISALPEDLLLQILVCLRCTRTAARTSLISHQWFGLWTQLPDLIFRNLTVGRILPALTAMQEQSEVSLLEIRVPRLHGLELAVIPSLFHAAAELSPVDFTMSLPRILDHVDMDLPCFPRATSIQLYVESLRITLPPWHRSGGGFPALQKLSLSLSGCSLDLAALVRRCPCLRTLWVTEVCLDDRIDIRSQSLQELHVRTAYRSTHSINVETPVLKKLTMLFCTGDELSVSVVAPVLEKLSWECSSYCGISHGLGPWGLSKLSLGHAAAESQECWIF